MDKASGSESLGVQTVPDMQSLLTSFPFPQLSRPPTTTSTVLDDTEVQDFVKNYFTKPHPELVVLCENMINRTDIQYLRLNTTTTTQQGGAQGPTPEAKNSQGAAIRRFVRALDKQHGSAVFEDPEILPPKPGEAMDVDQIKTEDNTKPKGLQTPKAAASKASKKRQRASPAPSPENGQQTAAKKRRVTKSQATALKEESPTQEQFVVAADDSKEAVLDIDELFANVGSAVDALEDQTEVTDSTLKAISSLLPHLTTLDTLDPNANPAHIIPAHLASALISSLDNLLSLAQISNPPSEEDPDWEGVNSSATVLHALVHILSLKALPVEAYTEESCGRMIACVKHLAGYLAIAANNQPTTAKGGRRRRAAGSAVTSAADFLGVTQHTTCTIFKLANLVARNRRLVDSHVLQLSVVARDCFFVDGPLHLLQLEAIPLFCTLFSKYETHRGIILDDFFNDIAKMPTQKRKVAPYHVAHANASIQMISALLPQLVHVLALHEQNAKRTVDDALRSCNQLCKDLTSRLIGVCIAKKTEDANARAVLDSCMRDWLILLPCPEWPSVPTISLFLCTSLAEIAAQKGSDTPHRLHAIELLGQAAAALFVQGLSQEGDANANVARTHHTTVLKFLRAQKPVQSQLNQGTVAFHLLTAEHDTNKNQSGASSVTEAEDEQVTLQEAEESTAWLNAHRRLGKSVRPLLQHLVALTSDPLPGVRTRALRSFASIVDAEAAAHKPVSTAVLGDPAVRKSVHERFLDVAISVREAALDLVGHHINRCALADSRDVTAADQYSVPVSRAMVDTGVSVRKRALRIVHDVYMQYRSAKQEGQSLPAHRQASAQLVHSVVQRLRDPEESVSELAGKCAEAMLLSGTPESSRGGSWNVRLPCPQSLAVSTETKKPAASEVVVSMEDRVTEICEVLSVTGQTAWFVQLVRACSERKPVMQLIERMVSWLVDRMVEGSRTEWNATLLNALSEAIPPLGLEYILPLRAFLKAEYGERVIHATAQILTRTLPLLSEAASKVARPSAQMLESTEADLLDLINKQPTAVVISATECLAALTTNITHHHRMMCELLFKHLAHLQQILKLVTEVNQPQVARLQFAHRLMFITGVLCRFYDFEHMSKIAFEDEDVQSEQAKFFSTGSLHWRVLQVFSGFFGLAPSTQPPEHALLVPRLRITCIQSMGHVFVRAPAEMFTCQNDIRNILALKEGHTVDLAQVTLQMISSVLAAEEKNMQTTEHRQTLRLKHDDNDYSVSAIASENADSGVSSSFMQQVVPELLQLLTHSNSQLRKNAVGVMALVLKAGMVHPACCVSQLVALHTDSDPSLRQTAHHMLLDLVTKHAQYVLPAVPIGVLRAWEFQKQLKQENSGVTSEKAADSLSAVYQSFGTNKPQRLAFLSSLLRIFDSHYAEDGLDDDPILQEALAGEQSNQPQTPIAAVPISGRPALSVFAEEGFSQNCSERMEALRFVCLVLSRLPYSFLHEVMHVAQEINRLSSLYGSTTLHSLSAVLAPHMVQGSPNSTTQDGDCKELVAPPKAEEITSSQELLDAAFPLCEQLTSVLYLLALKSFLRDEFQLSNSLFASLSEATPSKPTSDKTTVRRSQTPASLELVSLPEPGNQEDFTVDQLVKVYAQAHAMIESDSVDMDVQWRVHTKTPKRDRPKKRTQRTPAKRQTTKKTPSKRKRRTSGDTDSGDAEMTDDQSDLSSTPRTPKQQTKQTKRATPRAKKQTKARAKKVESSSSESESDNNHNSSPQHSPPPSPPESSSESD